MCGIVGMAGGLVRGPEAAEADLRRASAQLAHRGPDDEGTWVASRAPVALATRRLAVIDLTDQAHQPMVMSGPPEAAITFNGEIYNFAELRADLEATGERFRSSGDTEVLLIACRRWGVVRTLERLRGMFAFAYYDEADSALWLVRDRFGEKPLYYAFWRGGVAFASELKALRAMDGLPVRVDAASVEALLRHGYIGGERTIYEGVHRVSPGTALRVPVAEHIDATSLVSTRYWDPVAVAASAAASPFRGDLDDAADAVDEALGRSVVGACVGDVPLGAFLSGGVDSTSVVSQLARRGHGPVHTFTLGLPTGHESEAIHAERVAEALGTRHTTLTLSADDALRVVPTLPDIYDEPFGDSSQIASHLVAALARRDVTVALSGDGGDELFGGYARFTLAARAWTAVDRTPAAVRHLSALTLDRLARSGGRTTALLGRRGRGASASPSERLAKAAALVRADGPDDVYRLLVTSWWGGTPLRQHVPEAPFELPAGASPLARMLVREATTYLADDILTKVDRAAMAVSLETRVPFLDPELYALAHSLPESFTVAGPRGKRVLRHLLARHVDPAIWNRPKQGFHIPLNTWLRGPLRGWAEELLSPDALDTHGLFDQESVRSLWLDHLSGRQHAGSKLWSLLAFQAWHERWIAGRPSEVRPAPSRAVEPRPVAPPIPAASDAPSRLRALVVIPSMSPSAGAETSLFAVAPYLQDAGIELRFAILSHRQELVPELRGLGIETEDLSGMGLRHQVVVLRRLLRSMRPDLVHASLFQASAPTQLAALGTGVPILVTWASTPNTVKSEGLVHWKLKVVRCVDAVLGALTRSRYHAVTAGVARTKRRELLVGATRVQVAERGRDPDRFRTLDPTARDTLRSSLDVGPDDQLVLAIGRQESQKGYDELLPVFDGIAATHPRARLVIAGRTGNATPLLEQVRSGLAHPERVHLLGHRDDVPELLDAADLVVCASHREGAAGALLEAMGTGTPVVCVELSGLEGILVDGENAIVVPRERLAEGIAAALDNPEAAAVRAAAARKLFEERFTVERSAAALGAVYRWAAGPGAPRRIIRRRRRR